MFQQAGDRLLTYPEPPPIGTLSYRFFNVKALTSDGQGEFGQFISSVSSTTIHITKPNQRFENDDARNIANRLTARGASGFQIEQKKGL